MLDVPVTLLKFIINLQNIAHFLLIKDITFEHNAEINISSSTHNVNRLSRLYYQLN